MSDRPLSRCSCPLPGGSWGRDGLHLRVAGPVECLARTDLQPGEPTTCAMGCGGRWVIDGEGVVVEEPDAERCAYRGTPVAYAYCESYWRHLGCRVLPADPGDLHALAGCVPVSSELLRARR